MPKLGTPTNAASLFCAAAASLLLACGGGGSGCADAGGACVARFSGNFTDTIAGASACPATASASGALTFAIASSVAGAPTDIEIDVGTLRAGTFSSASVARWKALRLDAANCEFSAGSQSVPQGSFTLTLTSVAAGALHGSLSVTQYVKSPPGTACAAGDTEQIDVSF